MNRDTLAYQLGTTEHISPLLMKAKRLGLRVPEDLEGLAQLRGCRYYQTGEEASRFYDPKALGRISLNSFSNAELAIALLSLGLQKSQARLRLGAAMLGAEGNKVGELVRLARQERVEPVVRHIAGCGARVEPDNQFWSDILASVSSLPVKPDVLPHISRFVAMTGITRKGTGTVMQWIRPVQQATN